MMNVLKRLRSIQWMKVTLPVSLLILIILCFLLLYHHQQRPALPVAIDFVDNQVLIPVFDSLKVPIKFAEDIRITHPQQLDMVVDFMSIGDSVTIQTGKTKLILPLVQRYRTFDLNLIGLVALIMLLTAGIIAWFRPQTGERYLIFSLILGAITISCGWPGYHSDRLASVLTSLLYFFSYPQSALLLFFYSYFFPVQKYPKQRIGKRKVALQFIGITVSSILSILYFIQFWEQSLDSISTFLSISNGVFYFLIGLLMLGLLKVVLNEWQVSNPVSQKKLQWVFAGLLLTGVPILIFWGIPRLFRYTLGLPDIYLPVLSIPFILCWPMALFFYRALNIHTILLEGISRCCSIMLFFVVFNYFRSSLELFQGFNLSFYLLFFALMLVSWEWVNWMIRYLIDRYLFRVLQHQQQIIQRFDERIREAYHPNTVLSYLLDTLKQALNVRQQLILRQYEDKTQIVCADTDTPVGDINNEISYAHLVINSQQTQLFETSDYPTSPFPPPWLIRVQIDQDHFWLIGEKLSGLKIWEEDLELIEALSQRAAEHISLLASIRQQITSDITPPSR